MPCPWVTDIRVQDLSSGTWYTYHQGVWDTEPIIVHNPNNPIYIAAYACNDADCTPGPCYISIREGTTVLAEKYQDLAAGECFGLEWNTIIPNARTFTIYAFAPPDSANAFTVDFTVSTEAPIGDCVSVDDCTVKYGVPAPDSHWECQNHECVQVPDTPSVECNTTTDCVSKYGDSGPNYHWECQNNLCVLTPDPTPPPQTYIARSIGPFGVPSALLRKLWQLREKLIRKEVHKKIHPVI